jgi:DNA-damage-inducible protein J
LKNIHIFTNVHDNVIQKRANHGCKSIGTNTDRRGDQDGGGGGAGGHGLDRPDAVRLMLTKVAKEHALPFDPLIPNARTIAAIKEARAGKLLRAKNVTDLRAALNAGN